MSRVATPNPGLKIGQYDIWPPVELAPMAGVTNRSFRQLCRELGGGAGGNVTACAGGLYVCEMTTTQALVARNPKTMAMIRFSPGEYPRSLQLYGIDPAVVSAAVRMVADEDLADHIDLNFGCPVPKVTRKGGGAALPYKRRLFEAILRAAVSEASRANIPVTIKMRIGIDEDHRTFVEAGRIAEQAGVSAIGLHARTAQQHYSGRADWDAIAELKGAVTSIPVLGNGDIFRASEALEMIEATGCDGVVVGRGCQGRPWLFAELAAMFDGRAVPEPPRLAGIVEIMIRHAELLCEEMGADRGMRDLRKHIAWYLKGFAAGSELRRALGMVSSLAELEDLTAQLDLSQPFPEAAEGPRGRQGGPQRRVHLPYGWLDDPDDLAVPEGAEIDGNGG
ncbi:MAG: tRNA dihydrouridine synthase DusB [Actinobacteria bacterium 69-20]|nr:tRNA dihydrouridine synthase DusB [Actinomycetota bacterium]OJV26516.1 MAG: tRNA dihydrouridine synthase DusB [Actinobacteria bacterium 69-20]